MNAQKFEVPATNPRAKVQQRVAATDIEVTYNRPGCKGRVIFGGLVPYDQVWRTGSDASTKVSFSTPVSLNGHVLDSGSYELFSIPAKAEWTIILQKSRSQWGSYAYSASNDAVRFVAIPQSLPNLVESFTIGFDNVTSKSTVMYVAWENTWVPITIEIDLRKTVVPQLEASLKNDERKPYFRAAMFYYENDLDIDRAAELMTLALRDNPNHLGMLYRQALILERKGDKKGAVEASEKSLKEAQSAGEELKREYTSLNTILLQRLRK